MDVNKGIIYKVTNQITGKSYIGLTTRKFKKRKQQHKLASKFKKNYFYNSINKYGWNNFLWETIEIHKHTNLIELSNILNDREIYNIKKYDTYENRIDNPIIIEDIKTI